MLISDWSSDVCSSDLGLLAVLTYLNEVPLPAYSSLIPTFDISSVQVLKGPQGTLFGRNTNGGAVLAYTVAPTYDFEGYVEASYGNRSEEHTSELQSLMRNSYAVFCLKKKNIIHTGMRSS